LRDVDRLRGDLKIDTHFGKFKSIAAILLEQMLSLGMRNQRPYARIQQPLDGCIDDGPKRTRWQFEQQEPVGVDREELRPQKNRVQILWRKMQFAAEMYNWSVRAAQRNSIPFAAATFRIEFETKIGVGRGNHIGDPVLPSHVQHGQRFRQIGCAVVDAGQNMCVQIDHSYSASWNCTRTVAT